MAPGLAARHQPWNDQNDQNDSWEQFFLLLLIAIPLALLLAALAGQAIARRALMPLERMTRRAGRITASSLDERLEIGNAGSELDEMAKVFNHLLERLEEAFRQLRRFTADASHELRTPLAAIRAISEVALEKEGDSASYREALGSVLEESGRLNETVDALLLLSTVERTSSGQTQQTFVLLTLMNEVISVLEILGVEREVGIEVKDADLAEVELSMERNLLRIALMNVIHNAHKFSPRGANITITCARPVSSLLQITIQDEGPGIRPGEHEKVFDRFFTGTSSGDQSGAGLGLAIAKLIVDRAGGRIRYDDAAIHGASCVIELPVAQ